MANLTLAPTLVNNFLRLIQKGQLLDQDQLQEMCSKMFPAENFLCPSLESVVKASNKHGDSASLIAARHGHVDVLKRLHRNFGVALEYSNADGKTALHEAAQNGQARTVEYLVGEGAMVDSLKRADWTPLMLACTKQDVATVRALLDNGASLVLTNKDGWTPFHLACREGCREIVELLLEASPDCCWNTTSNNGRTPLHSAALHGNLEVVKLLHERCPYNADSADSCGVCPVMDAARGNHVGVVQYLVEAWHVDLSKEDVLGRRVLHHASQSGADDVIRWLVTRGADVNKTASVNAISPLHYAAKEGQVVAIETLLSLGADPSLTDKVGRTALDIARGARCAGQAVEVLKAATSL